MPASPVLTIDQFLSRIEKVRTSAGVAQRVLRLIENQDFNVQQVVGILETDPALATQILRLVNSSYFGLPRRVANLQQAVCLLGAHTLRLSLLNYGVLQCLAKTLPAPRRDEFLRHSLTVATIAEKLVRQQGDGSPEDAYCTGLIADVGVLAFAQIDPAHYEDIFLNNAMGTDLLAAEQACFGFDHATLGARLLQHWHLPEAMAAAVAVHHELPQGPITEATPLQVAGIVAEALWMPQSLMVVPARSLLKQYFDFSTDDFIQLAVDTKRALADSAAVLSVPLAYEIDVEHLRRRAMELFVAESVAAAVELDGLNALVDEHLPPVL